MFCTVLATIAGSLISSGCPHSSRNTDQALLAMDPAREEAHLLAAQVGGITRRMIPSCSCAYGV